MKVSGSILAVKNDYFSYAKMLKYAKVDCIHIDIFQDEAVFSVKDILEFDRSYPPLDVHLIFENVPEQYIDTMNVAGVRYLNLQYENLEDKSSINKISNRFKGDFGIAITAETPLSVIDKYVNCISQVLFMCSMPGVSGAQFDMSNFKRIEEVHDKYPSLRLFADGGINNIIGKRMERIGVDMVVSGSYLCHDIKRLSNNVFRLKYMDEKDISVKRIMIKTEFLPIIGKATPFIDVVNVMNHFCLGIVMITEDDRLCGVLTDGDIRRGYLRYGEGIFQKKALELMNARPYVVDANMKIENVYSEILVMKKGINIVPVINNNKLVGAIDLRIGV